MDSSRDLFELLARIRRRHGSGEPNIGGVRERIDRCRRTESRELDLDRLNLKEVPEGIFDLHRLEVLTLEENAIGRLPDRFASLSKLAGVFLANNRIESLPKSLCALGSLRSIDLTGNRLRILPEELCRNDSIELLIVSGNDLTRLPAGIGEMRNLRGLRWTPEIGPGGKLQVVGPGSRP